MPVIQRELSVAAGATVDNLIGPALQEARLLRVAHQFQQATDWHLRRPPEPRSVTTG